MSYQSLNDAALKVSNSKNFATDTDEKNYTEVSVFQYVFEIRSICISILILGKYTGQVSNISTLETMCTHCVCGLRRRSTTISLNVV